MFKDFKEFAMRGSVVDMAVGIIIGVAFGAVIKSLVADVLMPPIGLLLGNVDFTNLFITLKAGKVAGPYASLAAAQAAGATDRSFLRFIVAPCLPGSRRSANIEWQYNYSSAKRQASVHPWQWATYPPRCGDSASSIQR